jgi:hypothetical protein
MAKSADLVIGRFFVEEPFQVFRAAAGNEIQPSLRDWRVLVFVPGVETPGYFRVVPTGLKSDLARKRMSTETDLLKAKERVRNVPSAAVTESPFKVKSIESITGD